MPTLKSRKVNTNNRSSKRLNISKRNGKNEVYVLGQYYGTFVSEKTAVSARNSVRRALQLRPAKA